MDWRDKLDERELYHLKYMDIKTLDKFKTVRALQKMIVDNPRCMNTTCCKLCSAIARKINLIE